MISAAESWRHLSALESIDLCKKYFNNIHGRSLNTARAEQISASLKQAKEYFTGAEVAGNSIKPLLSYYGVACLTRAVSLIFSKHGGEESLKPSHGLTTLAWDQVIGGTNKGKLSKISELRIATCGGLLEDFIRLTKNKTCLHVRSSGVDWSIPYECPPSGLEISLGDLWDRLPDLSVELDRHLGRPEKCAYVNEMTFDLKNGLVADVRSKQFEMFSVSYVGLIEKTEKKESFSKIYCQASAFQKEPLLLVNTYLSKTFGSIPNLFLAERFGQQCLSQLSMTFTLAYINGMLCRYFPTVWMALQNGTVGDSTWPLIQRSQQYVEFAFPEMVSELILFEMREKPQLAK